MSGIDPVKLDESGKKKYVEMIRKKYNVLKELTDGWKDFDETRLNGL